MVQSDTLVGHDAGPDVSPYASTVCHIAFGGGRDLSIPRDLLRGTGKLNDLSNIAKGNQLRLEHISYEVGHILVHYLHTGAYQTLSTSGSGILELLDLSLQTYVTAINYGVAGLAELAKERVLQFASASTAISVLQATTKACQQLEGDDQWVVDFVTSQVRLLFEDAASLDRHAFLDCFGTSKAANAILVIAMIEYCSSKNTSHTPPGSSLLPGGEEWAIAEEPAGLQPEAEVEDPVPVPRADSTELHERESTMSPMPADSEPDAEAFEDRFYAPVSGGHDLDDKSAEPRTNGHFQHADANGANAEALLQDSGVGSADGTATKKDKKKKKNKKKKTMDDVPVNGVETEARVLGGAPLNGTV